MTDRIRRMLIVLATLSLVLGACGGGAGTTANEDRTEAEAETAASDAKGTAAPAQGGDADALTEMQKKRRQATFKVEYKWTSQGRSGSSSQQNETWYSKPPRSRIDFGNASEHQWMSQFILDNGVFVCQTTGGKSDCWKGGGEAKDVEDLSFTAAIMTAWEGILTDPSIGASRETRMIAGQQGSCAKATNVLMLGFSEITVCYAKNGVPLLLEWKAGSDLFRMEATSYTTTVAEKEFELPAKPMDQ